MGTPMFQQTDMNENITFQQLLIINTLQIEDPRIFKTSDIQFVMYWLLEIVLNT